MGSRTGDARTLFPGRIAHGGVLASHMTRLAPFPADWGPTRQTLHAYSQVVGAVQRRYAPAHPKWWHIGLKVTPRGLAGDPIPLEDGGAVQLTLRVAPTRLVLDSSDDAGKEYPLEDARRPRQLAEELFADLERIGLAADYDDSRLPDDVAGEIDGAAASAFWRFLVQVDGLFRQRRAEVPEPSGPVQLWPHGFDMSFEWFGTKRVAHEEHGKTVELPSQLNLGFYPGEDPYFYSSPWPFDPALTEVPLPSGAEWHTEGWQGSMLRLADVAGHPDAVERIRSYAAEVFRIAAPTL